MFMRLNHSFALVRNWSRIREDLHHPFEFSLNSWAACRISEHSAWVS